MRSTQEILRETKSAAPQLMAHSDRKNAALKAIADRLISEKGSILEANAADVEEAREKYGDVMIDRLTLTKERIAGMAQGMREVAALPDPNGRIIREMNTEIAAP